MSEFQLFELELSCNLRSLLKRRIIFKNKNYEVRADLSNKTKVCTLLKVYQLMFFYNQINSLVFFELS